MKDSNLKILLREYEQKKLKAEKDADKRKEKLYLNHPELSKIENELNKAALKTLKSMINKNDPQAALSLGRKISALKEEKIKIFKQLNLPSNYLLPYYECPICKDTGYITKNYQTTLCNCIKQKVFDIEYNKTNMTSFKNDTFDKFNFNYYSNEINPKKYSSSISPYDNIKSILHISKDFIMNFNTDTTKNLLFTGNTGLGKTFLSNCITNELLSQGKTVLYQTAPMMLDAIIDEKINKNKKYSDFNLYDNILNVDLLVIDDLGTECLNSFKFTELFNILNTRLSYNKNHPRKTIISTNLTLENLLNTYDSRIMSRILGEYNACRFFGDDIRILKRTK